MLERAGGAVVAPGEAALAVARSVSRGLGAGGTTAGADDCTGAGWGAGTATAAGCCDSDATARDGIWSAEAFDDLRLAGTAFVSAVSAALSSGFASIFAGSTVFTSERDCSTGFGVDFSSGGKPSKVGSTRNGVIDWADASLATRPAATPQQRRSGSGEVRLRALDMEELVRYVPNCHRASWRDAQPANVKIGHFSIRSPRMPRKQQLRDWVAGHFPDQDLRIETASADASFRSYFRVTLPDGATRIVMDAPPEHEDCRPYLKVARLFGDAGVHVPQVFAEDLEQGFLMLSDLGNTTYLGALKAHPEGAPALYREANAALVRIQAASRTGVLPEYDRALLERELQLFPEWYVARHLNTTLDEKQLRVVRETFDHVLANNLAQPQVFVHRDYHSRNLMLSEPNPGILDFQDAVYGPITYDLVSLYRDAYITWEEDQEMDWVIRYWEAARAAKLPVHADFYDFWRDYEWMGVQRQIKVLGIFARLHHRDGKTQYLGDMPAVMAYLRRAAARYGELKPFLNLLDELENRQEAVGYTF